MWFPCIYIAALQEDLVKQALKTLRSQAGHAAGQNQQACCIFGVYYLHDTARSDN